MPMVSFIIPLFNHLEQSQAMLASLQSCMPAGLDHEIILSDDASTDGTAAWLATLAGTPRIKTLLSPHNRGFAANNNAAVRHAQGDVLALLNNDLLLQPGWLQPMLAVLADSSLKAGVVGNVQWRLADGSTDHAGVGINPAGQLMHIQDASVFQGKPVAKTLAVTGACMLLRRADFERVGGFDERYINGAEDVDLCFKLRQLGLGAYVALNSRVGHHVSLSRGPAVDKDERNSRLLYQRWRQLLKQELAGWWAKRLAGAEEVPAELDGLLAPALLATPQLAALRAAEALLVRQEARWLDLLGPVPA
jgi:GT2 family glycosyltransferase